MRSESKEGGCWFPLIEPTLPAALGSIGAGRGRLRRFDEMVLLDALAPGGRLASFSDSLEIFLV